MNNILSVMLKTFKPFFGDFKVIVDRDRKIVTIRRQEKDIELTYDQVIDEVEKVFSNNEDG